jgi:hypothetical protein
MNGLIQYMIVVLGTMFERTVAGAASQNLAACASLSL